MIRWFTPRGREAVRELALDLRSNDGAHLFEITDELRRAGVADDVLDLRGINLRGMDLAGAKLAGADLRGARLDRINLRRACLDGARLDWCSLGGAKLQGASLKRAFLRYANLTNADLSEADLEGATLEGSLLKETRMRRTFVKGVDMSVATLEDVDLSTVRRRIHKPSPTTRHRLELGAPPCSEPRRKTRRFKTHMGLKRPRTPAPPLLTQQVSTATGSFEHALAELLLDRDRVGRITVLLDGVEVVLYEVAKAPALKLA